MILIKLDALAQCDQPPVVSGDHSLHPPVAGQVAPGQGNVHSDCGVMASERSTRWKIKPWIRKGLVLTKPF